MATEKVVVEGSDIPVSQLSDLYRQIGDRSLNGLEIRALLGSKKKASILTTLSPDDMALLSKGIGKGRINKHVIQECLEHRYPFGLDNIQIDWTEVYRLVDIETWRFEDYFTPSAGDVWEVIVLPGVSMSNLVGAINKTGVRLEQPYDYESSNYADSRKSRRHDRDPYFNGAYKVSFPRSLSSDVDLKKMSYESYRSKGFLGITIYEKLLLELGVILATGRVMEKGTMCICPGSDTASNDNPFLGQFVSQAASQTLDYGVGFMGRGWNAGYHQHNLKTHIAISGSVKSLR